MLTCKYVQQSPRHDYLYDYMNKIHAGVTESFRTGRLDRVGGVAIKLPE